MRIAARTMLHRRFHKKNLGYEAGHTRPCSLHWRRRCQGCPTAVLCSLRRAVVCGGTSWHRLDGRWWVSPVRDLHGGWCMFSMHWLLDHSDVFPEFFHAAWYHVACICFMPQPQFWNHVWPHGQRGAQSCCCLYQLHVDLPIQVSCNVCLSIVQQAVGSGCPVSRATAGGNQLTQNSYATNFGVHWAPGKLAL